MRNKPVMTNKLLGKGQKTRAKTGFETWLYAAFTLLLKFN